MTARLAADAIVVIHALFVAFVIFGALLVLWRPKWAWVHLPALAWGAWIEVTHGICPLTPLEIALRTRAGEAGYEGGFIEHYLVPLLYPPGLRPEHQVWLAAALAGFNVVLYGAAVVRHCRRHDRH